MKMSQFVEERRGSHLDFQYLRRKSNGSHQSLLIRLERVAECIKNRLRLNSSREFLFIQKRRDRILQAKKLSCAS